MSRRPLHINRASKRPRILQSAQTGWYRVTRPGLANGPADTTVIDIYDVIGGFFGVGADEFVKDLRSVDTPNIEMHVNSPGGDVWDAMAIYNSLIQHPAQVHVIIDSLAASAASWVVLAGDRVSAMRNSTMMIHDALTLTIGNAADHREIAEFLDKMSDEVASIYADSAGGEPSDWRARMQAETWYNANEALEAGLVDDVIERDGKNADNRDLSLFRYAGRDAAPAPANVHVEDTATPVHHTATVDTPWDGGANEKRLPSPMTLATARAAYAWYDSGQVEAGQIVKAAAKLPHHEVSADGRPGAANLPGVRNALSRLPQSDIPQAEQDAVRRHLQAHLDDAPGAEDSTDRKLTEMLARADALLAGRDPDEKADEMHAARITGRLAAREELSQLT